MAASAHIQRRELQFDVSNPVGEGKHGTVYRGRCRGIDVALKVVKQGRRLGADEDAFWDEVAILSKALHPRVTMFLGVCIDGDDLITVSEYVGGGDMRAHLQKIREKAIPMPSLQSRLMMARDVAIGMTWLQCGVQEVILHRDLKPANLLLDEAGRVKICDFGMSSLKSPEVLFSDGRRRGSPRYMAPEVLRGEAFSEKADVFSFGMILWELATGGGVPYTDVPPEIKKKLTQAVACEGYRPTIPEGTNGRLSSLLRQCWDHYPHNRPTWSTVTDELSQCMIEIAVADPIGREYWKSEQLHDISVDWDDFRRSFVKYLQKNHGLDTGELATREGRDLVQLEGGRATISLKQQRFTDALRYFCELILSLSAQSGAGERRVSLEAFGKLLMWVGPIVAMQDVEGDCVRPHVALFEQVHHLVAQGWFHGCISSSEAASRLAGRPSGTFLVRFSSIPGYFTISVVERNSIQHHRVGEGSGKHSPKSPRASPRSPRAGSRSPRSPRIGERRSMGGHLGVAMPSLGTSTGEGPPDGEVPQHVQPINIVEVVRTRGEALGLLHPCSGGVGHMPNSAYPG